MIGVPYNPNISSDTFLNLIPEELLVHLIISFDRFLRCCSLFDIFSLLFKHFERLIVHIMYQLNLFSKLLVSNAGSQQVNVEELLGSLGLSNVREDVVATII